MKKIYIILFLASVVGFHVYGQNKKGDKLFKYYDYAEAIPFYQNAAEDDNFEARKHATLKLADCYRFVNNAPKAKIWYEKAVQFKDADPINYFYLGQALRTLGEYRSAAEAFTKFNELVPDSEEGKRYYQYCIDIQKWIDLPQTAEIKNVSEINSRYADFSPVFYRDGIVFTTDRQVDTYSKKDIYGWTNTSYLNLFYTIPEYYKVYWNGVPEPQKMSNDFNQSYHDGPACFSSDYRWIYLTRTEQKNAKKMDGDIKTHLLEIYMAEITGDKKPKFEAFEYNSPNYSVGHPALSPDGKKLIFSSDMPGGYGGSDLYMSKKENGGWSKPVNLGDKVNSVGDEVFPYWAVDSLLYFASDGHLGFGGLDIFKSALKEREWTEPENLMQPLNSSYDDFGIVLKENLQEGLFSSNRPEGKGSDDIYAFRLLKENALPQNKTTQSQNKIGVNGYVKDMSSQSPLEDAYVFFFNPTTDDVTILKTDENGYYETEALYDQPYVVKAMKDTYIEDCQSFRTTNDTAIKNMRVPQDLLLMKLEVDQAFKVENIYYDLDKWNIRPDAEPSLDNLVQIMKKYPITAELSSHTDSRASKAYNNELSQKRAEAAVRYIILHGVDPSRLTAKGYGESKLVNRCADGVDCTEAEHQENRRTEFKITSVNDKFSKVSEFDFSLFKEGDIIKANMLNVSFFDECIGTRMKQQSNRAKKTVIPKNNAEPGSSNPVAVPNESDKVEQKEYQVSDAVYRVQLIATKRSLDVETQFASIQNLVDENGLSVRKVGELNKYQLGNFDNPKDAINLNKELRKKGYENCFVTKIKN